MQIPLEWADRSIGDSPDQLPAVLSPLLRRIYRARGVVTEAMLDYSLGSLPRPEHLAGVVLGAERIARAIQRQEQILIVGDFDADGATSCAVAIKALKRFGAQKVTYLVPNRFEFGYGLSPELLEMAKDPTPELILTVDNGIAAHAGVDAANAAGIDVVITDHHLPAETLPEALAIINPQLDKGGQFSGASLAGVGVTFYLMLGVRAALREGGYFGATAQPGVADLLDLVALGTIADLVPLDHVNRALVDQGLRRIRAGQGSPGIVALLEVAGRNPALTTATDLAFAAAPRLNAAGRIADIDIGIECLLAEDATRAKFLADQLQQLNQERRSIEQQMRASALDGLEAEFIDQGDTMPPVLCVMREDWHQGIVGIVAGRLKEQYHRPVIAFAPGEAGELKGSGRSTSMVHMRDLLEAVDTASGHALITRFGGHAMAAGLTLPAAGYQAFKAQLEAVVRERYGDEVTADVILTDGALDAEHFTLDQANELRFAGPWGSGFPAPVFRGEFLVSVTRVLGEAHLKLQVTPVNALTQRLEAIAFNSAQHLEALKLLSAAKTPVQLIYRLDVNHYQGRDRLQLVVEHLILSTSPSRQ